MIPDITVSILFVPHGYELAVIAQGERVSHGRGNFEGSHDPKALKTLYLAHVDRMMRAFKSEADRLPIVGKRDLDAGRHTVRGKGLAP